MFIINTHLHDIARILIKFVWFWRICIMQAEKVLGVAFWVFYVVRDKHNIIVVDSVHMEDNRMLAMRTGGTNKERLAQGDTTACCCCCCSAAASITITATDGLFWKSSIYRCDAHGFGVHSKADKSKLSTTHARHGNNKKLSYRRDSARRRSLCRSRSFKVTDCDIDRKPVCDFLLANNTILHLISQRFQLFITQ